MRGTVVATPPKPDPVELVRKRTGTPRVGVPILDRLVLPAQQPVVLPAQPPVAGVIDPAPPRQPTSPAPAPSVPAPAPSVAAPAARVAEPTRSASRSPEAATASPRSAPPASQSQLTPLPLPAVAVDEDGPRGKRQSAPPGELNISQVWYDEGDQLAGDSEPAGARAARASKLISPSVTDLSFYEERPRRRGGLIAVIGVFAIIGGTAAYALTRSGSSAPDKPVPVTPAPAVAAASADAALSVILPSEPTPEPPAPAAETSPKPTTPAAEIHVPVAAGTPPAPRAPTRSPAVSRSPVPRSATRRFAAEPSYPILGAESTRRGPALPTAAGLPTQPSTVDGAKSPATPSLTDTPKDPYGAAEEPANDGIAPEKKAEFFANLGAQQLIGGDTAGAASNFKKAVELDGKNVAATIGMGEIALRQGLFGDAIAHLSKATKLAPRNARAFTLLGEAYLNSGNNTQAAAQFKKALQLDPDNARARDGYNEASSRVPPQDEDSQ